MSDATRALATVAVDGAQIVCRAIGKGPPLVVLNGFGATNADWDPSFINRLASFNELILLNNRGIGGSTDDGQSFDIAKLADDTAHVIGTDDIVIPASNALKLVNEIPCAWLAQFPHGGHAFMAQYPRALADLINSFLVVE